MHIFVAKLLSIAVMTYTDIYHSRNLRPMIRLICYAHSEQISACDRSTCAWRATPLSFDVSFLENPCEYPHKLYIVRNLESLSYMTAAIVRVYLYLLLRNSFRKPRKDVQGER